MARQLRIEFAGALYHIMARGNERRPIFVDDDDRRLFLEELWKVCDHRNWLVWAYCLLANHYHLLIETLAPTLSVGMRDLNGTHAQEFNRRHDRVGHLFQGRYVAKLVDARAYGREVWRYVVLNPVKAGLCRTPAEWRWSSYPDFARKRSGSSDRLVVDAVLDLFGGDRAKAERFVRAGIDAPPPAGHRDNPLIIGDDAFLQRVMALSPTDKSPEVPAPERVPVALPDVPLERESRNEAIRRAFAMRVFSQATIARHFGVHYSTVSRVLARGPRGRGRRRGTAIQDVTPTAASAPGKLLVPDAAIQDVTPS